MTTTRIEYPITASYMAHWDRVKALRELLQNAIDSGEYIVDDSNYSHITITNRLTQPVTLDELTLFGDSNKTDEHIGRFGEGFKLAMLVFARTPDIKIEVSIGNCKLHSVIESNRFVVYADEADQLPFAETFKVTIDYLGVCEDIRSLLLSRHPLRLLFSDGAGNQVLEPLDHRSRLFVAGMYICDIDTTYSYNFHPKTLSLGRDREAVSDFDLQQQSARLWADYGDPVLVAEMMHADVLDVRNVRYWLNARIKEAMKAHFFSTYGEDAILATSPVEAEILRTLNPKTHVVFLGGSGAYTESTRSSYDRERESLVRNSIPKEKPNVILEAFLERNKKHMRAKPYAELKTIALIAKQWGKW